MSSTVRLSTSGYLDSAVPLKTNTLENEGSITVIVNYSNESVYDILLIYLLTYFIMKTTNTLLGKCHIGREESENNLERRINSRDSLPFLPDLLQETQVPQYSVKSLVHTEAACTLRGKVTGPPMISYLIFILSSINDQKHFCTKGSMQHLDSRN